ncbi:pentatricopeptide repeat-containing protein At4g01990, mitochondrial-like [Aristolochia californica]|uniref:pentatricopeptide repeat-containing protein At4g01990, mitochondrial-like n=1 Tax=Aristolochia californica TaxID=171875 RepID=UPI0035E276C1
MWRNSIRGFSLIRAETGRRFSATAMEVSSVNPGSKKKSILYSRLSALGKSTSNATVWGTLDEWVEEGEPVDKYEIIGCANQLRRYKRYQHALEVIDWMEKMDLQFTYSDHAIRLDLLSKTEGVASAESYFTSLSQQGKNKYTYGALLNCYCKASMSAKAMKLFENMKELNLISSSLPYNNMMTLYRKFGQLEAVLQLFEEMKNRGLTPDSFTYVLLMQSYASLKDFEEVDRIMEEARRGGKGFLNWKMYTALARIYITEGHFAKAESTLQELEQVNKVHDRDVYHHLISLYAGTGNLAEVNRVWKSLKLAFPETINRSYFFMLHALARLKDLKGIKKCFEEWESSHSNYDIRLLYPVIGAHLLQSMIKESESLYENAVRKMETPCLRILEMFIDFAVANRMIDLGLKYINVVINANTENNGWKLSQERVQAFFKCLEEEKNVFLAEELFKKLRRIKSVDSNAYMSLVRVYSAAGRRDATIRQRMEEDGIEGDPETEKLLHRVCPK